MLKTLFYWSISRTPYTLG